MPDTNVGKNLTLTPSNRHINVDCSCENYVDYYNAGCSAEQPAYTVNYHCKTSPAIGCYGTPISGNFDSCWAATSKLLSQPVTLASNETLSNSTGSNQVLDPMPYSRHIRNFSLPIHLTESANGSKMSCPPCPSISKSACPSNSILQKVSSCRTGKKVTVKSVPVAFRFRGSKSTSDLITDRNPGISFNRNTDIYQMSLQTLDFTAEGNSINKKNNRDKLWKFSSGFGEPSLHHALVVIFLEFFAWGLLTSPMIQVLKETFPHHTFLMNGIIMGIKGILSFLSAPLIGALSDLWGRKFFLFITVFFTCLPIPFMKINTWWYFALISMSGVFAVTYSIVFAYVADVTDETNRHYAYGLVSATFAASLVVSPAIGAYLGRVHSDDLVVGLATAIAVLDIFFILVAVPESLPEKVRSPSNWNNTPISWEQADPFSQLVKVGQDKNIVLICVTVFLSYLPEAGQFSCFFVYLQLVMGFGPELVATFIAVLGVLSVIAQTALLSVLIKTFSNKKVISIGLFFELMQMMWYGFGSQAWMIWAAGVLAAISSITYPAISSYVSTHTDADKQGVVQGIVTGMRGLCSGLGPAMFGFIFYLFQVDLNQDSSQNQPSGGSGSQNSTREISGFLSISEQVPGPPFVFGAMMVLLALTVSAFIPETVSKHRKQSGSALDLGYSRDHKKNDSLDGISQPLMNETGIL